jgi:hypothetical protein
MKPKWWERLGGGVELSWEWNPTSTGPWKWLLSGEANMGVKGNNPHAWVRVCGFLIGAGLAWPIER